MKVFLEEEPPSRARGIGIARQICAALAAAHERGIVHRDVKPANVMVGAADHVTVLDFGLSRREGSETVLPGWTEAGAGPRGESPTLTGEVTGTPAYMSPEQARGEEATTASDVFSLGLVFHELFVGRRAWDAEKGLAGNLAERSEGIVPAPEGLEAELTALVLSMTAAAPSDRPTAAECGRRLVEIVEKPGRILRARLRLAALVALAMVAAGFALLSWRLRTEVDRATLEARKAQDAADFLVDLFAAATPAGAEGEDRDVRALVERGSRQVRETLGADPARRAHLMTILGAVHRLLGEAEKGQELLLEALAIRDGSPEATTDEVGLTLYHLAVTAASRITEDPEGADRYSERYLRFCRENFAAADVRTLGALAARADVLRDLGRDDEAAELARRAEELLEDIGEDGRRSIRFADALFHLAASREAAKDPEGARRFLERALEANAGAERADPVGRAVYLSELGRLLLEAGRYDEAAVRFESALETKIRLLGPGHRETLVDRFRLARLRARISDPAEVLPLWEGLLADLEELGGDRIDLRNGAAIGYASTLRAAGDPTRARTVLLALLDDPARVAALGSQAHVVWANLANLHSDAGELASAEVIYRRIWDEVVATASPRVAALHRNNLAEICRRTGRLEEAEALYREGLELASSGGGSIDLEGDMRRGLAVTLLRGGSTAAARSEIERARAMLESSLGKRHALTLAARALALEIEVIEGGDVADGPEKLADEVVSAGSAADLEEPLSDLAAALSRTGRHGEARRLEGLLDGFSRP